MNIKINTGAASFRGLCVSAAIGLMSAVPASAATVFATSAAIIVDGPRGTADGRDNLSNALGATNGNFFELGYDAVVDFSFGVDFFSSGSVVEITNGSRDTWLEGVRIEVGRTVGGIFTSLATASPNPLLNTGNGIFTFVGGPFDTVRLTDVTRSLPPTAGNRGTTGGFDVDSISVTVVPVPASALLLLGGLAGLAAVRRRKKS